jgi:acyl-CoA synthetase (AMP-forming)/AMP-acid ligase II
MTSAGIYDEPELAKNKANDVPLSPISMLKRTAQVHPERIAVIHGSLRRTWLETDRRCRRSFSGNVEMMTAAAPPPPSVIEAIEKLGIGELPKTSTGKIRKNELRDRARRDGLGTSD